MSQAAFDLDGDSEPTYSVGELADAINGVLRRGFGDGVWVRGEIQGWRVGGPHAYFTLVEQTAEGKATLNVQFFAPARARLRPLLERSGVRLADGLQVRIFGQLDFYAPGGRLGLKMVDIDPRFTLGDLAMQRDAVIRRLVATGLFDANRRVSWSPAPLRVGVVTSIDSAAWADFRHEIERSGLGFHLQVTDVRVQGDQAVAQITRALTAFGRRTDLDAVVLIRGGGARSELATFDDEAIAVAIAQSAVPVLTGLGHEIDRSVADEVAHLALKTPTACAAALVERVAGYWASAEQQWSAIAAHADRAVRDAEVRLNTAAASIGHVTVAAVDRSTDRLRQRVERLRRGVDRSLERADARLVQAAAGVRRAPARLDPEVRHLDGLAARVRLLDPVNTMARGWSITRTATGETVRDADQLVPGTELITTFARGSARSTVEETLP